MAEEFADLTGSRVVDERYAKNVVFDADGLNELLTHIKNYPVVEIETVEAEDTEDGKNIWQTFTEGSPCIKVIYGDENNLIGNLSADDLNFIATKEQAMKINESVFNIYNKHKSIESEYKGLIRNLRDELIAIVQNVYTMYYNYMRSVNNSIDFSTTPVRPNASTYYDLDNPNIDWGGTYYNASVKDGATIKHFRFDAGENYDTGWVVDRFAYKVTFEISNFSSDSELERIIIGANYIDDNDFYTVSCVRRNSGEVVNNKQYIVPFKSLRNEDTNAQVINIDDISWNTQAEEVAFLSNEDADGSLRSRYLRYNDLLIKTLQLLIHTYAPATSFDNNTLYYTYNASTGIYTPQRNLVQPEQGVQYYYRTDNDHIRSLLKSYINYIREARVNCYEEIRQFLLKNGIKNAALNNEVTEFSNVESSNYQIVKSYIEEEFLSKNNEDMLDEINRRKEQSVESKFNGPIPKARTTINTDYYYYDSNTNKYKWIKFTTQDERTASQITEFYTLKSDAIPPVYGYKYVKVGSNIEWDNNFDTVSLKNDEKANQNYGTFRITINRKTYEVPIKGFGSSSSSDFQSSGSIIPNLSDGISSGTAQYDLGSSSNPWRRLYVTTISDKDGSVTFGNSSTANFIPGTSSNSNLGSSTKPWTSAYITTVQPSTTSGSSIGTSSTPYAIGYFNQISVSSITGTLAINSTADGTIYNSSTKRYSGNTIAAINTSGGIYAAKNIWGAKVFNAVFNDYAECRTTINLAPGHVVIDNDDGSLSCSSQRLQPGAQVISDTYGHLMGGTENATTPIAVAGRVLVYTYQSRDKYHAGMAVCSAPDGTVDIMTREEIKNYPDCIIGIVSEIPQYEYWGSDNVKVNGRIWIKVK